MPFSRGYSQPRDQACASYISCIGRWVLYCQHHLGPLRSLSSSQDKGGLQLPSQTRGPLRSYVSGFNLIQSHLSPLLWVILGCTACGRKPFLVLPGGIDPPLTLPNLFPPSYRKSLCLLSPDMTSTLALQGALLASGRGDDCLSLTFVLYRQSCQIWQTNSWDPPHNPWDVLMLKRDSLSGIHIYLCYQQPHLHSALR